MASAYNYPSMNELKEKRKMRKGKELMSSEVETQPNVTEEATKSIETPQERSASKKRKQPIDSDEYPDEVVVRISKSTTVVSDPSGLEPFVDGLLLEEDENRFKELGAIETAKKLQTQAFLALEASVFLRKYAETCQRRMRELEKSNTSLRKELSESKEETRASQQRQLEAERLQKEAESVLELERATTKLEVDSYKEALGRLEERERALLDEMDEIAYGAMARERGNLARQYKSGEHLKWPVERWIRYSEKLDAGENPSSSEDEKDEEETGEKEQAEVSREKETEAMETGDARVASEEVETLGD